VAERQKLRHPGTKTMKKPKTSTSNPKRPTGVVSGDLFGGKFDSGPIFWGMKRVQQKDGSLKPVRMSVTEQLEQVRLHIEKEFLESDLSLTLCAPVAE
jgi:hypothetical protein